MNGALVKYQAMGKHVWLTAHFELPAQGQALHKFRSFRKASFLSLVKTHLETTCDVEPGASSFLMQDSNMKRITNPTCGLTLWENN